MRAKTVHKPWGREEWLEQNDRYCYKRIYILAGERTSFQYHEKKLETNYIIDGRAEVWLEDERGEIVKKTMGPGEFFTVRPPRKHRVVALTDLVLQECSTPEVDDVIRVDDDHRRPHGRIEAEHVVPALCILAAGKGARLEHLGEKVNKGLLPVRDKAVISHLIDLTPFHFDVVIALGHRGELIREYCEVVHPDRTFLYVDVDRIEGEGTGPGYSLAKCREQLRRSFYLVTADCLVSELPPLDTNWLGVHPTNRPEDYSTVEFDESGRVTRFVNKAEGGFDHAFIGLAGIKDHYRFWSELERNRDGGEVVCAFYDPASYPDLYAKTLEWTDVGTLESYLEARENRHSLPKKTGECLYQVEVGGREKCVKLFPEGIGGRHERARSLEGLTPNITHAGRRTLAYDWVSGRTLYEVDDLDVYTAFVNWCADSLWEPCEDDVDVADLYDRFYRQKTLERYEMYKASAEGELEVVNGKRYAPMEHYLGQVAWGDVGGVPTRKWHGDLQFDNGLLGDDHGFTLLDWRESFAGSVDLGDTRYDLCKLYGGVLLNYRLMRDPRNLSITYDNGSIAFSHRSTDGLTRFLTYVEGWLAERIPVADLELLTGLIYLNMAPLHERPFSELLFYKAKEMLGGVLD